MDLLSVGTGFFLGLRHSLEPDHVTAVAHFASADPRPRRGLAFGLLWGAGHGAAILLLALVLIPIGVRLGSGFERAAEVLVGLTLIGLALWRLYGLTRVAHEHVHEHTGGVVHSHPHTHGRGHLHTHAPTLTGFVHGAAGAVGVLALLPVTRSAQGGTPWLPIAAFCLGSLLAMGLFGWLAGRFYGGLALPARQSWLRIAVGLTALSGLVLGAIWISRNV